MNSTKLTADLQSQLVRLYQMAITDGDFSSLELKMLYDYAKEKGVATEELDKVLLSKTGKLEVPKALESKLEYLFDFAKMIWADGIVTEDELITLRKFCRNFGFLDENIDELSEYLVEAVNNGKTKQDIIKELNQ